MNNLNLSGIIPVFKPKGISSHDVINKLRKITGIKKIGHAGTLDPLASGVLIIAIGRENTKIISNYVKKEKIYEAEIILGANSSTDDEEGEKELFQIEKIPEENLIKEVLLKFKGKIMQMPPIYSALKIKGKPAYKYARKGEKIKLEKREIIIKSINIIEYKYPILKLIIKTGPGVYIRSLARDIGKELGTGAYLKNLVRTRVGDFTLEESLKLS